ncbi:MAG: hypothetical protein U9Q94_00015 [Candidatus Bipolaricaulota bacterium]|nr:hypothetical protein [Candidatus Bipolaricaulota bacterium]
MKRVNKIIVLALLALLLVANVQAFAQQSQTQIKARLLLVDETKTFASTMRVGALAGILNKTGMVDLSVKMIDVDSSYADPLAGLEASEQPYDLVLIIPKGIDDASISQIWLVSEYYETLSPQYALLAGLSSIVDQVFQGLATATDVSEDLWPAGYAALYHEQGWLR